MLLLILLSFSLTGHCRRHLKFSPVKWQGRKPPAPLSVTPKEEGIGPYKWPNPYRALTVRSGFSFPTMASLILLNSGQASFNGHALLHVNRHDPLLPPLYSGRCGAEPDTRTALFESERRWGRSCAGHTRDALCSSRLTCRADRTASHYGTNAERRVHKIKHESQRRARTTKATRETCT